MTSKGHVQSDREAYSQHRHNAEARGIPFLLSFEEWVTWWMHELGPDWRMLRGSERGKFVMSRPGDKGAYALGNIRCVPHADNIREWCRKLTEADIVSIYTTTETYEQIKTRLNVSRGTITDIRSGRRYRHITRDLNRSPTWGRSGAGEPAALRRYQRK